MKNNEAINRRDFIKLLAKGSVAGSLGTMGQLMLLNNAVAATPVFSGYKALVCVFLAGGNDSLNMLIPTDASYEDYKAIRGALAVKNLDLGISTLGEKLHNGTLGKGESNPYNIDLTHERAYNKGYYDMFEKGIKLGVNAVMPEFAQLISDNKVSLVANVGNLVAPITKLQIEEESANLPLYLFAHDQQQRALQTGQGNNLNDIGWAGKIADAWAGINNKALLGLNISYAGNDRMLIGKNTSPVVLEPGSPPFYFGMQKAQSRNGDDRRALFKSLSGIMRGVSNTSELNLATGLFDNNKPFKRLYSDMMARSMDNFDKLSITWKDNPIEFASKGPYGEDLFVNPSAADIGFASGLSGSLFKQLDSVAKMIDLGVKDAFNSGDYKRQIFFVKMGSFDTHFNQSAGHPLLLRELSLGLWKFQKALEELGHEEKVTTFSMSDFGRSVSINSGGGTDHAWGANHFVMGGAGNNTPGNLKGGNIIGTLPDLSLGGVDDHSNKGRIIPTLAQDQLNASICKWFGVDESLVSNIFPNLSNFETTSGNANSAYLKDLFVL